MLLRKRLTGETAIITGAANGLGKVVAAYLSQRGCKVILWDKDKQALDVTGMYICIHAPKLLRHVLAMNCMRVS